MENKKLHKLQIPDIIYNILLSTNSWFTQTWYGFNMILSLKLNNYYWVYTKFVYDELEYLIPRCTEGIMFSK